MSEDDVMRRLAAIERQLEKLHEDNKNYRHAADKRMTALDQKIDSLVAMASRWKGFFAGILGGGAFVGWLVSQWEKIKAMFQ